VAGHGLHGLGCDPALTRSSHRRSAIAALKPFSAVAGGALAVGALAVGAVAIGAVAIGRLVIRRVRLGEVTIEHLIVKRMSGPE
jgi:hypothetical protein